MSLTLVLLPLFELCLVGGAFGFGWTCCDYGFWGFLLKGCCLSLVIVVFCWVWCFGCIVEWFVLLV